jgi:hypothetical protein
MAAPALEAKKKVQSSELDRDGTHVGVLRKKDEHVNHCAPGTGRGHSDPALSLCPDARTEYALSGRRTLCGFH